MTTAPTTVFKWGYDGWGNSTSTLVRTVDAIEHDRGYSPPIFVDVRFSRSVRATGFRDKAFARLLGHARYRWMRSLGNAGIRERRMRIQCPDAVEQLLDLALDAQQSKTRLIFFCSCSSPHGAEYCHRGEVAKLLLRAAGRRSTALRVLEWPGGVPHMRVALTLPVTPQQVRSVRCGASFVQLKRNQVSSVRALPWGSLVVLKSGSEHQLISAGPSQFSAGHWRLPVFLFPVEPGDRPQELRPSMIRLRSRLKLEPIQVPASRDR